MPFVVVGSGLGEFVVKGSVLDPLEVVNSGIGELVVNGSVLGPLEVVGSGFGLDCALGSRQVQSSQ